MLEKILEKYDTLLVDLWGVVYDGVGVYSYVPSTIQKLRDLNKQIIFLSNSPRPSNIIKNKLHEGGLVLEQEQMVTSGDYFIHKSKETDLCKGKAFVFGLESNKGLLCNTGIDITKDIKKADYIIILSFFEEEGEWQQFYSQFKQAIQMGLTAMVPNPDIVAPHGEGVRYLSGFGGKKYEEMGGRCFYYGKPYSGIYNYVIEKYKLDIQRTVAIGDNLDTDIVGANDIGIASLLITSGLYKNNVDINKKIKNDNIYPKYILPKFSFNA